MKPAAGKIVYAFLFCVMLPAGIYLWSKCLSELYFPNVPPYPYLGLIVFILGSALLIIGMINLWISGKGLPMNAYPPKQYVSTGAFRLVKHPIYTGACLMLAGIAHFTQTSSLFWLITPLFCVGCIALVYGYEKHLIQHLFQTGGHRTWLSFPESNHDKPEVKSRIVCYILVILPWLLGYELAVLFNESFPTINSRLWFEYGLVWEWVELFYILIYFQVVLYPLLAKTNNALSQFAKDSLYATSIGLLLMFTIPIACTQLPIDTSTFAGKLLQFERDKDSTTGAFPSFHVIWALIIAKAYCRTYRGISSLWQGLAILVILSCWLTGMHGLLDIIGGIVVFFLAAFRKQVWKYINLICERLANSWREWHFHQLRIISHSLYAGLAGFLSIWLTAQFIPSPFLLLGILILSLTGAALWGQFIEGSPSLLRPFGYYGSILGGLIGVGLLSTFTNTGATELLGAIAIAAPVVQGVGRLRCLVQGCCHGKVTDTSIGIRVTHPKSRVCGISKLAGQPIHNTQLYSILSNAVSWLILIRLYWNGCSPLFITGTYFILNGLARFVEEAYRGEIQTTSFRQLRIYQWVALASILFGIILTCINDSTGLHFQLNTELPVYLSALLGGLFTAFAMGMDFPKSNLRFSRLSG